MLCSASDQPQRSNNFSSSQSKTSFPSPRCDHDFSNESSSDESEDEQQKKLITLITHLDKKVDLLTQLVEKNRCRCPGNKDTSKQD